MECVNFGTLRWGGETVGIIGYYQVFLRKYSITLALTLRLKAWSKTKLKANIEKMCVNDNKTQFHSKALFISWEELRLLLAVLQ